MYIAKPEKALIDSVYLSSLGRYSMDISAINIERFDQDILNKMVEGYPLRTKNMLRKYGFIGQT
jgi:hypothetical protein